MIIPLTHTGTGLLHLRDIYSVPPYDQSHCAVKGAVAGTSPASASYSFDLAFAAVFTRVRSRTGGRACSISYEGEPHLRSNPRRQFMITGRHPKGNPQKPRLRVQEVAVFRPPPLRPFVHPGFGACGKDPFLISRLFEFFRVPCIGSLHIKPRQRQSRRKGSIVVFRTSFRLLMVLYLRLTAKTQRQMY
ncbi:hypothetical protein SODALDRAFT_377807 [Sodiomyces alkalinus F11]|uniref:Uncharacterized protein n=1 Tax=Sodiomyces alkalinus (strain CBS 110278 / VKM F-3762 / F11) TaxID=1314773 RepID=A0A3N2PZF3_SODAK|nr:hypothetical protein SODALDRAFT_377807 [Sodiomyces alkalinus F11]ROT39901.1 hypothetical protein SODALDRAFT_377807 [Sodiomyces alkalinus F11]